MEFEIGIVKGNGGEITDLFHVTQIELYSKESKENKWEVVRVIGDVSIDTNTTLGLRESLEKLMVMLAGCKVLVGNLIIGMPYHILDRNGFILCEAEEFSQQLLEQIYEDYGVKKTSEVLPEAIPLSPQPVDNNGNFFLDFIKVQKYHPEVSSKKALLPFLSYDLFQTVVIFCSHVIPWLERFAKERNLELSAKREGEKYIVLISHNRTDVNLNLE